VRVLESTFTALFPFGGSGGGALGFLGAEVRLLGRVGRFRCLGSIDFDREACVDFERFTGAPAWCVDVQAITAGELVERYGARAPHVVFLSPPCKGSSRLLSSEKAKTEKYLAMNRLALVWTKVMLEAWGDDPPALILLENVPGLPQRASSMLRDLKKMLRAHGYVFHASSHDCGEIGGLAQHRERYLLVARLPKKCPSILYQPPKRRVRGVGEVLEKLPMPATHAAKVWGELHTMPKLSWRNWLRLALIPAGGDWRDLEGVLQGRARREVFRRHAVQDWKVPHPAVTGPGGHSVEAVADPRVANDGREWNRGAYGVRGWEEPSGVVTAGGHPSKGVFSVADPRVAMPESADLHHNKHAVLGWAAPSPTVIGKLQPSSGAPAVADPRVRFDRHVEKRSEGRPGWYGVLDWDQTARTISGQAGPGNGANSVADHRDRSFLENVRLLTLDEAMELDLDVKKPPPFIPVIVAEDGTWHRPMTKLELAMLQSYPETVNGERIKFEGGSTIVCEHIGNSVPPDAARAVAEQMAIALIEAEVGAFSLNGSQAVWVNPQAEAVST
jgi:site-specific DNA-cytosine methylase